MDSRTNRNILLLASGIFEIEIWDVADQAMRGKDGQAAGAGVEERHHGEFVGGVGIFCCGALAALVAIG